MIDRRTIAAARKALGEGRDYLIPLPDKSSLSITSLPSVASYRTITARDLIVQDHEKLEEYAKKALRFLGGLEEFLPECPFCKGNQLKIVLAGMTMKFRHSRACPLLEMIVDGASIMNPEQFVIAKNSITEMYGPDEDSQHV